MNYRIIKSWLVGLGLWSVSTSALLHAQSNFATPYTVTTYAGIGQDIDGVGSAARFLYPWGVAADSAGNLFVADYLNHKIRKISPAGVVTTFAGTGNSGFQNGPAETATFNYPAGVAVDGEGNVYVSDERNNVIRKISVAGMVSTYAGTGEPGYLDGPAESAQFGGPGDLEFDSAGNLYIISAGRIRKISASGEVTTLAGSATSGYADGPGVSAEFYGPNGLTVAADGTVYVADTINNLIRRISPEGVVTTVAGVYSIYGGGGWDDGPVATASFHSPEDVAVDAAGNLYVADNFNNLIRLITPDGVVSTLAGARLVGDIDGEGFTLYYSNHGSVDGNGPVARFNAPVRLSIGADGALYVADLINNEIRRITIAGDVTTFAGADNPPAVGEYTSQSRREWNCLHRDAAGNFYFLDQNASAIMKLDTEGVITVLYAVDLAVSELAIRQMTVDSAGTVYFVRANSIRLNRLNSNGSVTELAGYLYAEGAAAFPNFLRVGDMVTDGDGNIYVTDLDNKMIRKVTPEGVVTTLAGSGTVGSDDGIGVAASFILPKGLGIDEAGNLYVVDGGSGVLVNAGGPMSIRKVTPAGVVSTIMGPYNYGGTVDGSLATAEFGSLLDVAVDTAGRLYVVDDGNQKNVRRIDLVADTVTTLAGYGSAGNRDGIGQDVGFGSPYSILVDPDGTFYVIDGINRRIRRGRYEAPIISGGGLRLGVLDTTLNHEVAATSAPASFSATGLPAGLSIDPATGAITGTPTEKGKFTVTVSATNGAGTGSTTLELTVTGQDYAAWVALSFPVGEQADVLKAGPAADADGDGVPNLLEFVLGSDPKLSGPNLLPAAAVSIDGTALEFNFQRKTMASETTQIVEFTDSLLNSWLPVTDGVEGMTLSVTLLDEETETETVEASVPVMGEGKVFVRLRVEP